MTEDAMHWLNDTGLGYIDADLKYHPDDEKKVKSEYREAVLLSKAHTADMALCCFMGADAIEKLMAMGEDTGGEFICNKDDKKGQWR